MALNAIEWQSLPLVAEWQAQKKFLPLNAIKDEVRLPLRAQARMPLNATKKDKTYKRSVIPRECNDRGTAAIKPRVNQTCLNFTEAEQ